MRGFALGLRVSVTYMDARTYVPFLLGSRLVSAEASRAGELIPRVTTLPFFQISATGS
jgi:hypothetical protein